jgi:hypothetical protein
MDSNPEAPDRPLSPRASSFPRRRTLVLASALLLVAGAAAWFTWWYFFAPSGPPALKPMAEVLVDYLPPDTGAVVTADLRRLREMPGGDWFVAALFRAMAQRVPELRKERADLLGMNLLEDVDWAQLIWTASDTERPLVKFLGRIDAGRFQIGKDRLRRHSEAGFDVLEHGSPPAGVPRVTFAPFIGSLLADENHGRLLANLRELGSSQRAELQDARMRELLREVDRSQCLWLAISVDKLHLVQLPKEGGPAASLNTFQNLMVKAETIQGGLMGSEDITLQLVFTCRGAAEAQGLEQELKNLREAIPAFLLAIQFGTLKIEKEFVPLLQGLASAEVASEGRGVTVSCRIPGLFEK